VLLYSLGYMSFPNSANVYMIYLFSRALTEKIVAVLPRMKCPHRLEPHQIQGLDFISIFPVIQVTTHLLSNSFIFVLYMGVDTGSCGVNSSPGQGQCFGFIGKNILKLLSQCISPLTST